MYSLRVLDPPSSPALGHRAPGLLIQTEIYTTGFLVLSSPGSSVNRGLGASQPPYTCEPLLHKRALSMHPSVYLCLSIYASIYIAR